MNRKNWKSASERRRNREARQGWALIAACALALVAMVCGAAAVDEARGISVSQSLQSAGL